MIVHRTSLAVRRRRAMYVVIQVNIAVMGNVLIQMIIAVVQVIAALGRLAVIMGNVVEVRVGESHVTNVVLEGSFVVEPKMPAVWITIGGNGVAQAEDHVVARFLLAALP